MAAPVSGVPVDNPLTSRNVRVATRAVRLSAFDEATRFNASARSERVGYLTDDRLAEIADSYVNEFIYAASRDDPVDRESVIIQNGGVIRDLSEITPFIKHVSFAHEQEYRLVSNGMDVRAYVNCPDCKDVMKDHLTFELASVREVMVGPRCRGGGGQFRQLFDDLGIAVAVTDSRWGLGRY